MEEGELDPHLTQCGQGPDGDPAPQKGGTAPQFWRMYCGQTVAWVKMKLGVQVGLGPGHSMSDGDPTPRPKRGTALQFSPHICCGQMAGWIKMSLGMEVGLGRGDIN